MLSVDKKGTIWCNFLDSFLKKKYLQITLMLRDASRGYASAECVAQHLTVLPLSERMTSADITETAEPSCMSLEVARTVLVLVFH